MSETPQIPLIDVAAEPVRVPAPPAEVIYLVAAFKKPDGWRIIHRSSFDEYSRLSEAENVVRGLSPVWSHACILRCRLGGGE